MLSNLLDITGFFVSVLINLLLIALICYYFKKKIDNLEFSQSEQAKTLYALLSQQRQNSLYASDDSKNVVMGVNDVMNGLDMTQLTQSEEVEDEDNNEVESDSESGEESEDGDEDGNEDYDEEGTVAEDSNPVDNLNESIHMEQEDSDMKKISYDDSEVVVDKSNDIEVTTSEGLYEKMTVKELKSVLAEKGVQAKSSMVKGDIINMLKELPDTPVDPVEEEE